MVIFKISVLGNGISEFFSTREVIATQGYNKQQIVRIGQLYDQVVEVILAATVSPAILARYAMVLGYQKLLPIRTRYGVMSARALYDLTKRMLNTSFKNPNEALTFVRNLSQNYFAHLTTEQFLGLYFLHQLKPPTAEARILDAANPALHFDVVESALMDLMDTPVAASSSTEGAFAADVSKSHISRNKGSKKVSRVGHGSKTCPAPAPVPFANSSTASSNVASTSKSSDGPAVSC
ncbi:hypothetical protein CANARDRAFT_25703 [[Candida] arabinofermentans NRRL YB-2248]|uniref:Uncharacterized protein n=1 Tax=[Candida] arabinofermentans NRRL YB-2248 TaxID=983967 RepID=A0A1E4STH5_9ASCO|nr:hypothetical protein CANARDRAFT_25703 [[Candida] arabinofermentans NRRL YB-2248]